MKTVSRTRAAALLAAGLLATGAACVASSRGMEPVATWLYPFAWYPLLLAAEGGLALRRGRFLLLDRPRLLLSVLAWSVPLWMLWEILNFRVQNWYYVFVPDRRISLWTGVVVSFATVLPACFLPAALLSAERRPDRTTDGGGASGQADPETGYPSTPGTTGRPLHRGALRAVRLAGVAMLVLPLVWPRLFFPLIWGCFVLLVEPDLYRKVPSRSLLADAAAGRWDRIGALLGGGAVAGLAWEALNSVARAGWIYTVPGLEGFKLFEMPLLGFLGFPPLALCCFSLYQWLALRGWAVPLRLRPAPPTGGADEEPDRGGRRARGTGPGRPAQGSRGARWARVAAVAVVIATLLGMERWTISSRTPRLRDLPGLLPSDVETLQAWGVDSPFTLAGAPARDLAGRIPGVNPDEAERWVETARLATARGLGTRNARYLHEWGIESLGELARADPDSVAACFRSAAPRTGVRPSQVRVWWRAARRRADVGREGGEEAAC